MPRQVPWCSALVAALLSGCSFAFVEGPPRNHRQLDSFYCTAGSTYTAADMATSALFGLITFAILAGAAERGRFVNTEGENAILTGITTVGFGWSAYTGHRDSTACKAAYRELAERRATAPPLLQGPPGQAR
jgi:hypothetical protein